jgi:hypothetical protein
MNACTCKNLPEEFPGRTIAQIPELQGTLEKVEVNYKTWTTLYRCTVCGQLWEEKYEASGHGEVPHVRKITT